MEYNLLASFSEIMTYVGYVMLAILVLLIMITVHELGHYLTGKALKFSIDEFSIGFGPPLIKKKGKSGEVFSLRLVPLGGYCAFTGEDEGKENKNSFGAKEPWKRILVLVSGAVMNYLFALLIIIIMFGAYGQNALVVKKTNGIESTSCQVLQVDDVILKANGKNVYLITDLMNALQDKNAGETVEFVVKNNGKSITKNITLLHDTFFNNMEDVDKLNLALGSFEITEGGVRTNGIYSCSVRLGFFECVGKSVEYSFKLAGMVFQVLGELLTGKIGLSSMGGTVTTITVTAEAIMLGGLRYLMYIASFIGVNLAVFNLLPIPALDGARIIFTVIEWIRKKPVNKRVESIIHTVGLVLVFVFAVICDLQRCF